MGHLVLEEVACLLANQAGAQIAQLCQRVLQVCVLELRMRGSIFWEKASAPETPQSHHSWLLSPRKLSNDAPSRTSISSLMSSLIGALACDWAALTSDACFEIASCLDFREKLGIQSVRKAWRTSTCCLTV